MRHFKPILTGIVVTATFLLSCNSKKDVEAGNSSCKLTQEYRYVGGVKDDSVTYTYTGNKATKVQYGGGEYYTLQYNGEYVTRRNNFQSRSSTTPSDFLQVTYNTDNTVQKIESLEKASSGYAVAYRLDFSYTSGKLSKVTGYDVTNNVATKIEEYTYTYTGENITSAVYKEIATGDTEAATFTYDNKSNYFKAQNIQLLLIDAFLASDGLSFPLIMSGNNVVGLTISGVPVQITYETDSKQNLTTIKVNNQNALAYTYQCQ